MTESLPARPWLAPFVPLYQMALLAREMALRTGLEPVRRLRWPVVSIGNLSAGGSGKTPLAIALAKALAPRGLSVDVLSRGYGRLSRTALRVDSQGTAEEFGDEPLLIARESGVPVFVADQRYQAGLLAESIYFGKNALKEHGLNRAPQINQTAGASAPAAEPARLHLLDDGFQHRRLHRDVDILLLEACDFLDWLLPAGNLREPARALHRAHVLAIPAENPELEVELNKRGWQGPLWRLRRRMEVPPVDGPVVAFCGIARPGQFFAGLEAAGMRLAARIAFPDHHRHTLADLAHLASAARSVNAAAFLTTAKDRVRLAACEDQLAEVAPLQTVQLRIEIEKEDEAVSWLVEELKQPLGQPGR